MHTPHHAAAQTPIKVSVVVPVHNTGEPVLTGLRSFLAQTMPRTDFEVIYVDDGSTDDTVPILDAEIAAQGAEDTVRVIRIENSGWPGRPRNVGTDAARGEYVHYVDDDDRLAPEALEREYARARETGADIVIGRMAGHGRTVPRVLFERPTTSADLREDTALLASMTVHKLFRRAFLEEHRLRFAEGKVRLEDHLFMLRAFLLTDRVATVHDHTCYHWVRHEGDRRQNISYRTIDPGAYVDSIRRVLAVLDAPDTYVAPGPHRYRLAAKWYGKKALDRITGHRLLKQPDQRRAEWIDAVGALAADMPEQADRVLPTRLRIVAALARHGDRRLLEEYAEFDAAVDHQPRVEATEWHDGKLTVRCATRLVRKPHRRAAATPVAFTRPPGKPDGHLLRLPSDITAAPGVTKAADFTGAVRRSTVRGQLRHREGGTELAVPTEFRLVESPAPAESAWRARLARLADRLRLPHRPAARRSGTGHDDTDTPTADRPGRTGHALRYEAEFTVDPATADHGKPLAPGTWELRIQLGCGGWRTARRLRGLSIDIPAGGASRRLPPQRRSPEPALGN